MLTDRDHSGTSSNPAGARCPLVSAPGGAESAALTHRQARDYHHGHSQILPAAGYLQ